MSLPAHIENAQKNREAILAGRQAADWNAGKVGTGIAHILGIPAVTLARKVDVQGQYAVVKRLTSGGYEVIRSPLPALVVVSNELGLMRYPTVLQRREAKNKPVASWSAADVGLEGAFQNRLVLRRLFVPEVRKGRCEMIEGETPAEAGRNLARRLKNDGVI